MFNDCDYDNIEEPFDLPEELSYEFASNEVIVSIKKKWKQLKEKLKKYEELSEDVDDFDKLINYFIL